MNISDTLTHWARAYCEAIEAGDAALEKIAYERYTRAYMQPLASEGAQ
jgi:hypothetical protein